MEVTQLIVDTTKKRIKVYLNDEYIFWLSKKEIEKFDLKVGQVLSTEKVNNILENIVLKKAKSKALSLLKYSDRTEYEMRKKLELEGYLEDIIERVIVYLKEYNYIDDYRYACQYIDIKKANKSPYQLKVTLLQKGVEKDVLDLALETTEVGEEEILRKLLVKKSKIKSTKGKDNVQRLYQFFVRKGFDPALVMKVIKEFNE
jgi:regulatory protein